MFKRPASTIDRKSTDASMISWVRGFFLPFLISVPVFLSQHETARAESAASLSPTSKKASLPFYVYGDESGKLTQFVPSGYMGDNSSLSTLTMNNDASAPASTGRASRTSMRVDYSGKGKQGWAGIYWLAPANNWGTLKGAGYDLSQAKKITFWLRGQKGGERISQIKIGGVNGPYPDSDFASMGPVKLSREWKQYTISLEGKDLHYIIGGFMFLVRRADNPQGASFYMDEVVFQGKTEAETIPLSQAGPPPPVMAEGKKEEPVKPVATPTPTATPTATPKPTPTPVKETKVESKKVVAKPTPTTKLTPVPVKEMKKVEPKKQEPVKVVAVSKEPVKTIKLADEDIIPTPGRWLKYKKSEEHEKK